MRDRAKFHPACRPAPGAWAALSLLAAVACAVALAGCFGDVKSVTGYTVGDRGPTSWSPPQGIQQSPYRTNELAIGADGAGNFLGVWKENDGQGGLLLGYATFLPGGGWGPSQSEPTGMPVDLNLTIDDSGKALAAGLNESFYPSQIWAKRYDPASGWAPDEYLGDSGVSGVQPAPVANAGAGIADVLWDYYDMMTPVYEMRSSSYSAGWSAPATAVSFGGSDPVVRTMNAAVDATGAAAMVWTADPSYTNTYGLYTSEYDPVSLTWSTPATVDAGIGSVGSYTTPSPGPSGSKLHTTEQVRLDGAGNVMLVWSQFDGAMYHVWWNYYTAGAWSGPTQLESGPYNVQPPRLVVDGSGVFTAVWTDGLDVHAQQYQPGAGWQPGQIVSGQYGGVQGLMAMDANAAGDVVIVWHAGLDRVVAARFDPAMGWRAPEVVQYAPDYSLSINDANKPPAVAVAPDGSAAVLWTQWDGTNVRVFASESIK